MKASPQPSRLPLFPLQTVLFPGGLLALKVFEARYLDLVSTCLREQEPFGVVALRSGEEVGTDAGTEFESIGTRAELIDVDGEQPGILRVRCRGTQRFSLRSATRQADGLWTAPVEPIEDDDHCAPDASVAATVRGLETAFAALEARGNAPFLEPYRFDDAGWVANRWCEILPLSLAAKQRLMALPDAQLRLQLVDEFLRGKGVVS
ncbi:MAG: LON peptidase substrate-binding domain-containing protein [Rhizobacter sp.]|nr:LON peptidase substrate-binding domain-containing protein [Rhizobacter sp.]